MFLALFTASCKVRGRSGWSNWYGQVLQWQGGGQVGERNPAPRVDERNRDFTTAIPDGAGPMGPTTPKVLEGYTYCELHLKLKRKAQPAVL